MPQSNDRLYRKTRHGKPHGPYYGWFYPSLGARARYVCLKTFDRRVAATRLRQLERSAALATDPPAHDAARVEARGPEPTAPALTLPELFADFLDYGCRDKSKATNGMYLQKARHLLRLLGRDRDVHALVLEQVDEYIRAREDEGAHGGTVYKEIVALRQALKWAVRRKRLHGDPSAILPPLKNVYVPRRRHLSVGELGKLLHELLPHRRCWTIVMVYTGARRSDLERLVWREHIDLDSGWVHLPGTKTKRADRSVPISDGLRSYLESFPPSSRRGPSWRRGRA